MPDLLRDEPSAGVVLLTLNRPSVKNALNLRLLQTLTGELESVDRDAVRCVVLTGAGDAFSAGADIKEEASLSHDDFAHFLDHFGKLATLLRELPVPVIAAVNGWAIAGGFELAAQCDIRIVADGPFLSVGATDVGLSPTSGLTWTLPRLVGLGEALYLTLASPRFDGATALRYGFAQEAVRREEVLPRSLQLAAQIAAKPPAGIRHSKAMLHSATTTDLATALAREQDAEMLCYADPAVAAAFRRFLDGA